MKFKFPILIILLSAVLLLQTSCKKLVEVSVPVTAIAGNSAFTSDATAIAVLTAMYAKISGSSLNGAGSIPSITLFSGLSGDELTLWSGSTNQQEIAYYRNNLSSSQGGYGYEFWLGIYPYISSCNSAIEGLTNSSSLTPAVKKQLLGEAYFMRAYFYFYLVNLYGDVALPLSSDYKVNSFLKRTSKSLVYQQIISDLQQSENQLSNSYLDGTLLKPTTERVRPTKWAAAALLARVYVYTGNWINAKTQADSVINNSSLFGLLSLKKVFLKATSGVSEAIWQLQPVNSGWNTEDAKAFIMPSTGPLSVYNLDVYLSNNLLGSFEPGDQRKVNWVDSTIVGTTIYYYPYKYTVNTINAPVTEYIMLLRLGELYLIRAEAKAHQGDLSGAAADLNNIRSRASLSATSASSQSDLLTAIQHERQVELFAELGQRWLDIKRTNSVDSTMNVITPKKGGIWRSYQQLYPIYYSDIQLNPNLVQNIGY
jgi:hypothetical protein